LGIANAAGIYASIGAGSEKDFESIAFVKTLYVAWKKKDPGGWFPVGRLDADVKKSVYTFRYTHGAIGAAKEAGFAPFDSFPDLDKAYVSGELFPFFLNRVQNPNRPSFPEYLARLGLAPNSDKGYDPIELLAMSEGRRETDTLEIFPRIERVDGMPLITSFFLHGLRYLPPQSLEETLKLQPKEELTVAIEVNNPAAGIAIQLQTRAGHKLGYAPRYLVHDLVQVSLQCEVRAWVGRVNPPPTPPGQRVLVIFEGCWPEDYQPMSGEEFQPVVELLRDEPLADELVATT
jgi:hypothetical protein